MSLSSSILSASSYADAQAMMRANPGVTVRWDAGMGWMSEGFYSKKLRRAVCVSINPQGERC